MKRRPMENIEYISNHLTYVQHMHAIGRHTLAPIKVIKKRRRQMNAS